MSIICKPFDGNPVIVTIGSSEKKYWSKKEARRKVAWRLLFDTNRLDSEMFRFWENRPTKGWVHKRHDCECADEYIDPHGGSHSGVFSKGCPLHDKRRGYYKRLQKRIVKWLEKGYIAPDSGLKD